MSRRGKVRKDDPLLKIKNKIRGSRQTGGLYSELRATIPQKQFQEAISWLRSSPVMRDRILHQEFPKDLKFIKASPVPTDIGLERELLWAAAYLLVHGPALKRFVQLSSALEIELLTGSLDEVEERLGAMESEFGLSLWSVKTRISALQLCNGLESQKAYTNKVTGTGSRSQVVEFIAHYTSWKIEPSVSIGRFATQFFEHLDVATSEIPTRIYLRYHLLYQIFDEQQDLADILRVEGAGCVVDYYETFVFAVTNLLAVFGNSASLKNSISAIRTLAEATGDLRLIKVVILAGGEITSFQDLIGKELAGLERFVRGEFSLAQAELSQALDRAPSCFELIEASAVVFPKNVPPSKESEIPLYRGVVERMALAIRRDDDASDEMPTLLKMALAHCPQSWAIQLLAFVISEASSNPQESGQGLVAMANLNARYLGILRPTLLTELPAFSAYLKYSREQFGKTSAVSIFSEIGSDRPEDGRYEIAPFEQLRAVGIQRIKRQEFDAAILVAEKLLSSEIQFYSYRGIRLKAAALFGAGRIIDCLEYSTSVFVAKHSFHIILPIEQVLEAILSESNQDIARRISFPILIDIFSKHVSKKHDARRSDAYEDFLIAHGLSRPSQLRLRIEEFDRAKLIYFLRYVCVQSVMDTSIHFDSSRDVEEERLAVCQVLADIDQENVESYQSEIKEITRGLMIQRRMQEVEQSKIYVDTDGLKKAMEKSLRENFNRYISFLKSGIGPDFSTEMMIVHAVEQAKAGNTEAIVKLQLPKNEMSDLLTSMVIELRDQFVSGSEYGLDGYLSVRIRHGTLSGQLRSPLDSGKLITQFDPTSGKYKGNDFWLSRLDISDDHLARLVTNEFEVLSREFDQFVQEIVSKWIQIKRDAAPDGLFDFTITKPQVALISSSIGVETTFEEFLEPVLLILRQSLANNLEKIKNVFDGEIKARIIELLTSFQARMHRILLAPEQMADLDNAIQAARTEMQVAIGRIANWFSVSKTAANEPFLIEDAVSISIESVKRFYPSFNPDLRFSQTESFKYHGSQLSAFVDIFFIIFENIARHSNFNGIPIVAVKISYEGRKATFYIENQVGASVACEVNSQRVAAIKQAMRENKYMSAVAVEGGTGLHKIRKIVSHDLAESTDMDFGFTETAGFFVQFSLNTSELEP